MAAMVPDRTVEEPALVPPPDSRGSESEYRTPAVRPVSRGPSERTPLGIRHPCVRTALCEVHSRSDGPGSATPIPCLDRSWDRPAHRPSRPVSTGSQTYPLQIPTLVAIERSIADPARFCIAVGDLRRRRDSPLRRDSIARIRGRDGRYDVFWGHYSSLVGIPTTTAVRATCPAPVGVGGDADFVRLMPATGESPVYERVRPREVR